MSDTVGAVQALLDASALWIGSQKINLVPFRSGGGYAQKKKKISYFSFSSRRILC